MMIKNKKYFPCKGYYRQKNIQVYVWKSGGRVEFYDNEGYPFDIVLDFEDVEKIYIYKEMKRKLVKSKNNDII